MLKSMTAFGRARETVSGRDITAEIKSVNGRYFDCTVKLPRAYSFLEEKIKAHLQQRGVARGKVEVYVGIETVEQEGVVINLDTAYAASYIAALRQLRDMFGLTDDITVSRVAANRDIFTEIQPDNDMEKDWTDVRTVLDQALDTFFAARESEGGRLEMDMLQKMESLQTYTAEVERLSETDITSYASKLETRIRQLLDANSVEISEQRILTEVAIFADKAAIDEELVRLRSHFNTFREITASPEPAGRKLDFLMQELNRETNTIGSKAGNAEIARLVVSMKSELEKIREQIQNVE